MSLWYMGIGRTTGFVPKLLYMGRMNGLCRNYGISGTETLIGCSRNLYLRSARIDGCTVLVVCQEERNNEYMIHATCMWVGRGN